MVKRDVTIFDRFKGRVIGLKYYKGSIPMISDFHYFWEVPVQRETETGVLAIYFSSTGLAPGSKNTLRIFGRNGGTVSLTDP